ncbi:hypothetical protein AK830_g5151 [Neonectria ditissima]|uniref:Uncharacterized protein n=1 Tax=Neonectria ditissima TaxID=78410 RepID=A0A0P7BMF1_9HYPO|nr:hypothetical protein AK830_g5151 [Neonectria ditissima]
MADRKKVSYTFKQLEDWQKHNQTVILIVKEDTGVEHWISNRSLPPTSFPPPLSLEGIDKLKELDGVVVEDIPEDKQDL